MVNQTCVLRNKRVWVAGHRGLVGSALMRRLPACAKARVGSVMDSEFTSDWFTGNIDNWTRWLAEFRGRPGVRAIEVGSFEGRSACWLLENILTHETSSLDCYDLCNVPPQIERFRRNTEPWKHRLRMHPGPSFATLSDLRGEYDVAYIDGDHAPFAVLADATLIWPSLKVGAVLIFDDYLWLPDDAHPCPGMPWHDDLLVKARTRHAMKTPKVGIDGFLTAIVGHYELLGQDYQLAVRKTRETGLQPLPEPHQPTRSRWLRWPSR
jgi:predicted O-methyltransferase YrrM